MPNESNRQVEDPREIFLKLNDSEKNGEVTLSVTHIQLMQQLLLEDESARKLQFEQTLKELQNNHAEKERSYVDQIGALKKEMSELKSSHALVKENRAFLDLKEKVISLEDDLGKSNKLINELKRQLSEEEIARVTDVQSFQREKEFLQNSLAELRSRMKKPSVVKQREPETIEMPVESRLEKDRGLDFEGGTDQIEVTLEELTNDLSKGDLMVKYENTHEKDATKKVQSDEVVNPEGEITNEPDQVPHMICDGNVTKFSIADMMQETINELEFKLEQVEYVLSRTEESLLKEKSIREQQRRFYKKQLSDVLEENRSLIIQVKELSAELEGIESDFMDERNNLLDKIANLEEEMVFSLTKGDETSKAEC